MDKIKKVVIWGYTLAENHTHRFIHYCWDKTFRYMRYDTYWFSDVNHPTEFDFKNCLFITEGYADKNIPLHSSNVYIVHICVNPEKYINCGARLIEMRYNVYHIKDCNYDYSLENFIKDNKVIKISDVCYYHPDTGNEVLASQHRRERLGYEAFYTSWATDLLPHEFNETDIVTNRNKRERIIYYIGSISGSNMNELYKFGSECIKYNIGFKICNPWETSLDFATNKDYMQRSYLSPDLRGTGDINKIQTGETGTCHKSIGYIPCRVLKAISYGCLGITNSKAVYELLNKKVIYCDDESKLFYLADKEKDNTELIKEQMNIVKEKHTYINRVNDIINIINKTI